MDGADVLSAEGLHVADDVPAVFHDGLPLVEDGDALALYLSQQLEVTLRVERGVYAYAFAPSLCSLADVVQPFYHLTALLLVRSPVVTTAAEGQEGHRGAAHTVHGVEAVGHQCHVVVALREVLGVEAAHGHGPDFDAERVGHGFEVMGLSLIAQLIVEQLALAQAAHV